MTDTRYKSGADLKYDVTSASYQMSFVTYSVFEMKASRTVFFFLVFWMGLDFQAQQRIKSETQDRILCNFQRPTSIHLLNELISSLFPLKYPQGLPYAYLVYATNKDK